MVVLQNRTAVNAATGIGMVMKNATDGYSRRGNFGGSVFHCVLRLNNISHSKCLRKWIGSSHRNMTVQLSPAHIDPTHHIAQCNRRTETDDSMMPVDDHTV